MSGSSCGIREGEPVTNERERGGPVLVAGVCTDILLRKNKSDVT